MWVLWKVKITTMKFWFDQVKSLIASRARLSVRNRARSSIFNAWCSCNSYRTSVLIVLAYITRAFVGIIYRQSIMEEEPKQKIIRKQYSIFTYSIPCLISSRDHSIVSIQHKRSLLYSVLILRIIDVGTTTKMENLPSEAVFLFPLTSFFHINFTSFHLTW